MSLPRFIMAVDGCFYQ